jgi:hypothetical protein
VQKMSDDSAVYDEPAGWIIEQASERGAILSRRQLADWHRAGLIAKPDREFFGGPDGSESIYPRGTLRQAVACSMLMKEFGSIERVGWELWMRDFSVAEHHWRGPLREAHEVFQQLASIAADAENENSEDDGSWQSDAVDRLIETVGNLPRAPGRLGVARRRLRGGGFNEFLSIGISAATGAFEVNEGATGETADPVRILSRLLGTEPGRHKAAVPPSPFLSVSGRAVAENLEMMAQFLPRVANSMSPDTITESAIASARDEFALLAHSYLSVRQNEARIQPGSTPDLALIGQLFERLGPRKQAALLLIWLAVRDVQGWRENLHALREGVLAELKRGNDEGANAKPPTN